MVLYGSIINKEGEVVVMRLFRDMARPAICEQWMRLEEEGKAEKIN